VDDSVAACAAAWHRAHGPPLASVVIRSSADDFQVDEELGFAAAGEGEHDLLRIEKSGANTEWVARQLARYAGVKSLDVGYSGLKDRHALTTQYFSVRRPDRSGTDWSLFAAEGVRVLGVSQHNRKLRRGAHAANHFRIALRSPDILASQTPLVARWQQIATHGVPNYFGPQRFGHNFGNIDLARAVFAGKRVRREQRSIAFSAARSWLFNEILSRRVENGSWNRLICGDLANLDGSGSVFAVDELSSELNSRCADFDIHPSASLWGERAPLGAGDVADLETAAVRPYIDLAEGVIKARIIASSRATRLPVAAATLEVRAGVAWASFRLPRGGFATSVLRELVSVS
jgi:tRNA pseudouridine13 synthase